LSEGGRDRGVVEAIFISPEHELLPDPIKEVEAVPGKGLRGDRHFGHAAKPGRDLTLIEAEAIEALATETGIEIQPAEARRNVLTRGIDLNALVGERFRVGEIECVGRLLNEPCAHLESLTRPGVLRGLVHRGGLRADILRPGRIRVGDAIGPLTDSAP
jgi:MOSC domain-containing protein YiiM